jgi:hypothetical protein
MAAGRGALTVVGLMAAVIVAVSFFLGVGFVLAPASVHAPAVQDQFYFPVQGPSDQDALGQVP